VSEFSTPIPHAIPASLEKDASYFFKLLSFHADQQLVDSEKKCMLKEEIRSFNPHRCAKLIEIATWLDEPFYHKKLVKQFDAFLEGYAKHLVGCDQSGQQPNQALKGTTKERLSFLPNPQELTGKNIHTLRALFLKKLLKKEDIFAEGQTAEEFFSQVFLIGDDAWAIHAEKGLYKNGTRITGPFWDALEDTHLLISSSQGDAWFFVDPFSFNAVKRYSLSTKKLSKELQVDSKIDSFMVDKHENIWLIRSKSVSYDLLECYQKQVNSGEWVKKAYDHLNALKTHFFDINHNLVTTSHKPLSIFCFIKALGLAQDSTTDPIKKTILASSFPVATKHCGGQKFEVSGPLIAYPPCYAFCVALYPKGKFIVKSNLNGPLYESQLPNAAAYNNPCVRCTSNLLIFFDETGSNNKLLICDAKTGIFLLHIAHMSPVSFGLSPNRAIIQMNNKQLYRVNYQAEECEKKYDPSMMKKFMLD
jgi:hypothetical protein